MTNLLSLILLLLIIPVGVPAAFGIVNDFTTDKPLYNAGDELEIIGNVSYDPSIPFVTVQIFTPGKSNFADFNTISVNSDGSFSALFHVGGPTWTADGIYPIKVTYDGNLEKSVEYKESSSSSESTSPSESSSSSESTSPTKSTKT